MKIGELVKLSGVPKQTIHFYLRDGLLRKPRKSNINTAEYNESHLEQLRLIKDLRDNYFLPIPEIKLILKNRKKQSSLNQTMAQIRSKYLRPLDQLLQIEIRGRENFRKVTGLSEKWLAKLETWKIFNPRMEDAEPIYSHDDVIIGKLTVEIGDLGFGPRQGYDPADLKIITDMIQEYVASSENRYMDKNLAKVAAGEYLEEGSQLIEVMSLFFYHTYRKHVRERFFRILEDQENE